MPDNIHLSNPARGDGPAMKQIARDTGVLSVNSTYYYALMVRHFEKTCMVARHRESVSAYITGFFLPDQPNTLFVWQIGVAKEAQGKGIGKKLMIALVEKTRPDFIEATIEPNNTASINVFKSTARHFGADCVFSDAPFFDKKGMGTDEPPENLMRIGPIHLTSQK